MSFSEEFIKMSRADREALWDQPGLWDAECDRIYDKVYKKTYRNEMVSMAEPSAWYEAKAQQLATNLAEDAVSEYLIKKDNKITEQSALSNILAKETG